MELNKIIIKIENKENAQIVTEILSKKGIMWANRSPLSPEMMGASTSYIIFNKFMKMEDVNKAKVTFPDREIVSAVDFVNAVAPDFMAEKIKETLLTNAKRTITLKGSINLSSKGRGIKISNKEQYDSVIKSLKDAGYPINGLNFKADTYIVLKKVDGAAKTLVIKDYSDEYALTDYDHIADLINVDRRNGKEGIITVELIENNDKCFKAETEEELEWLFDQLKQIGATWVSGVELGEHYYGLDVLYGVYKSTKSDAIVVFFSEISNDKIETINVGEIMEKAPIPSVATEVDEKMAEEAPKKRSRIVALKSAFPQFNYETKGFRFSNLTKEELLGIIETVEGNAIGLADLNKKDLVDRTLHAIDTFILNK